MARIAIVGPGAVGSVLAALLHQTGRHSLQLCARRPLGSLRVQTTGGMVEFAPEVCTDPARAGAADWVFITTKAYDSGAAAQWLPALGATGAPVAVIQNGVEHRERFAAAVPPERIVPVMVDCPAERGADRVVQRAPAVLVAEANATGRAFVELFGGSGAVANTTPDLKSAVWRKLCINAAGVVSALVDRPAGVMRTDAGAALARALVSEVMAVGRAEGAVFDPEGVDGVLARLRAAPVDGINSLHADVRGGRPTEIDARNGVVVRLGRKHGIATPYNEMAVELITLRTSPAAAR